MEFAIMGNSKTHQIYIFEQFTNTVFIFYLENANAHIKLPGRKCDWIFGCIPYAMEFPQIGSENPYLTNNDLFFIIQLNKANKKILTLFTQE